MRKTAKITMSLALALAATACGNAGAGIDAAAHEAEVLEWREGRLERLLAPNGFLTQVGLFWIEDGSYSVGSAVDSDIRLPDTAAPDVGTLEVSGSSVRMVVEEGVDVRHSDDPVMQIDLPPDTSGEFVLLQHGSIAWSVIERGGKLAVRVRDYEHPWVASFGPLPYYAIDPALRIDGTLQRYAEPREVAVDTVIEGFQQFPVAPGIVTFEIDGQTYDLEPTLSGDELFFVFGDDTNRDETYGAGRFLYADMPGDDGKLVLDFNRSYSPPCAFNDFSTCPIASPRNRLPIRIEAGEKFEERLHFPGLGAH